MRSVVRKVAGSLPTGIHIFQTLFHIPVSILSSKTNNFGKDSQPKLSMDFHRPLAHDAARSRVLRLESLNERTAVLCSTTQCHYILLKQVIRGLMGSLPR